MCNNKDQTSVDDLIEFVYPRSDCSRESNVTTFKFESLGVMSSGTKLDENENGKEDEDNGAGASFGTMEKDSLRPTENHSAIRPDVKRKRAITSVYRENQSFTGVSVEDAVRDEIGCRPRANSTDGELNLPQRGLCEERKILEAHRWHPAWKVSRPKGFLNLGNTCYLNSTLQCLAHLPALCQCLANLQKQPSKSLSQGEKITLLLRTLFREVHQLDANKSLKSSAISPRDVVRSVPMLGKINSRNGYNFRPGRQEDAHEFLVHVLDAMQDGELRAAGINQNSRGWRSHLPIPRLGETTLVHRVFGGYLRSQVRCTKCDYRSNTYDPFLDLALEVSKRSCKCVSSALKDFTRVETLDAANKWRCSGCKRDVCATKQLTIFRPPLTLCVQLKRFAYNQAGLRQFKGMRFKGTGGSKITKAVEFPYALKLPLSDGRKCAYELAGVIVHVGGSASSGHYTAFVKRPKKDGYNWFRLDDSFVEAVSEKTVLRERNAYILFYSRSQVAMELPVHCNTEIQSDVGEFKPTEKGLSKSSPSKADSTSVKGKCTSSRKPNESTKSSDVRIKPLEGQDAVGPDGLEILLTRSEASVEFRKDNKDSMTQQRNNKTRKSVVQEVSSNDASITETDDLSLASRRSENVNERNHAERARVRLKREGTQAVEIMVGPRKKSSKPWKPSCEVASLKASTRNDLLGDSPVFAWEDEFDETKRTVLAAKQLKQSIKARKRSLHLDRWDSILDKGKSKKRKAASQDIIHSGNRDSFQRIQNSVQRMKRIHHKRVVGSGAQGKFTTKRRKQC